MMGCRVSPGVGAWRAGVRLRACASILALILASSWSSWSWSQGGANPGQFDDLFEGELDIDIEKEVVRSAPPKIAVPAARQIDGAEGAEGELIAEILRFDFEITGLFSPTDPKSFKDFEASEGFTADQINYDRWQQEGVEYLVKARTRQVAKEIELEMAFFQISRREQLEVKWKPHATDPEQLRQAVHGFANAVVEHMTGSKGVFGTRLVLAGQEGQAKNIFVMDIDGARRVKMSNNRSINVLPTWAGGGGVYFTSYVRDNPDLYFTKGEEARVVSAVPGTNHGAATCGDRIAVTLSMGSTNTDIYLLDPQSGRIKARLTNHWGIDTSPSWSPDCSQIAFVSDRGGTPQIYLMDASGGDQRRLTFSGRNNTTPEWSPKGDEIAFTGYVSTGTDIFITTLGGFMRRLTHCRSYCEDPTWSPDGNYIAFIGQKDEERPQLYISPVNISRSHKTLITREGGSWGTPSWERESPR